jgi:hypothetical protein
MLGQDQTKLLSVCGTALDSTPSIDNPDEKRQATLGGLVKVADLTYGLTVNHFFQSASNASRGVEQGQDVDDFDLDSGSDSELDSCHEEDHDMDEITGDEDTLRQDFGALIESVCEKTDVSSSTSDWTLVKNSNFHNAVNMITIPTDVALETGTLFITRASSSSPEDKVFITTRHGTITGFGQGDDAMPLPGLDCPLWAVQTHYMALRKLGSEAALLKQTLTHRKKKETLEPG